MMPTSTTASLPRRGLRAVVGVRVQGSSEGEEVGAEEAEAGDPAFVGD